MWIIFINKLKSTKKKDPRLVGLTGGRLNRELLFVDSANNVMSSLDLISLDETARNFDAKEHVVGEVAYINATDTLVVATWNNPNSIVFVQSFRRRGLNDWVNHDVHEIPYRGTAQVGAVKRISLRVLRDGTLLCGLWGTKKVHVCHPGITLCKHIRLQANHFGFDVQQIEGKGTRLAAAFAKDSVALFSLQLHNSTFRVVQLTREPLVGACNPLFSGDILLVGVASNGTEFENAKFYVINGEGPQTQIHLIASYNLQTRFFSWSFFNGLLYAWDSEHSVLRCAVYSYVPNTN